MERTRRLAPIVALLAFTAGTARCTLGDEAPDAAATAKRKEPTLTIAWKSEARSLEPGRATDRTSANVLLNVMDPLVKLGDDLEPLPNLAQRWEVSRDGRTVTFTLREDGSWTNGDPVTAHDFEYAWKRTLSPELGAPNAKHLFGVEGAARYHACEESCGRLRRAVGVEAVGDYELQVKLTSPQPWFAAHTAHPAFLAVHRETVETLGAKWTQPKNIVTNGPFRLEDWNRGRSITLVKNRAWRNAEAIELGRVEGRVIADDATRVQAFDAGEVMALDGSRLPGSDMPALRERQEYERYRALRTYYYGFNVRTIPDVHQRRAMSLAIDRRALVENVGRAGELPAIGLTPPGTPGFEEIIGDSPWVTETGSMRDAKAELDRAKDVKRKVNLFYGDARGNEAIAEVIRDRWRELGIDARITGREWEQYVGFLRPPNTGVDVYQLSWSYDVPDPADGLANWTCASPTNYSNFCDADFDGALRAARIARDADRRNELYAAAEETLFGADGQVPVMPIYWGTYPNLEALKVKDTFFVNPLQQIDFSRVEVE